MDENDEWWKPYIIKEAEYLDEEDSIDPSVLTYFWFRRNKQAEPLNFTRHALYLSINGKLDVFGILLEAAHTESGMERLYRAPLLLKIHLADITGYPMSNKVNLWVPKMGFAAYFIYHRNRFDATLKLDTNR
ncbi:MAG TPA: hypothetical protein VGE04_12945 [Chloroflexia bacterium]